MDISVQKKISDFISQNKVALFMKGTKKRPECGFSATVVDILKHSNCNFSCYNILQDDKVREGIKIYSNWPTLPQLYINGEFIGGCDIVRDLFSSGDLANLLKKAH